MINNYIINHALDRAWCSPEQDRQFYLKGTRVSRPSGEYSTTEHMGVLLDLPVPGERFHLWNVGQLAPSELNLFGVTNDYMLGEWVPVYQAMESRNLIMNVYTIDGYEVPRFKVWFQYTLTRSLVLAVQHDNRVPFDMRFEQLYFRVYSNAWYQSPERTLLTDVVRVDGQVIRNMEDVLRLQNNVAAYRARPTGHTTTYVNGRVVSEISPFTAQLGDSVEYIYDSSVKRTVHIPVKDLLTFVSDLDGEQKYLLHYPSDGEHLIEYHDDMDLHVVSALPHGRWQGSYVHRNYQAMVRMVTHRDYSLSVHKFLAIANALIASIGSTEVYDDLTLVLTVRHSGLARKPVYDNQRVFELYKLPDEDVVAAMLGTNANVPAWRAENLESSAYGRLMGMRQQDVTRALVEGAYGYNGLAKVLGDTPMLTEIRNTVPVVDVPIGLYTGATAYEYDIAGTLLGSQQHVVGINYECQSATAHYVEMIAGQGSDRPTVRFGTDNIPLVPQSSHRVYMCYLNQGIPNEEWVDITDSGLYRIENDVVVWAEAPGNHYLMVRFDSEWLDYEFDLPPIAGTLYFTLSEYEDRGEGYQHRVLPVPLGELDIWLNDRSLIRNLDYVVKFPKVFIVNRKYLTQPANSTAQRVRVRFTGFCKPDLQMDDIEDYGFIEHGLLSNNLRHDLRDDKVLRITVDGRLRHRDELIFSEEHSGVSVVNPINGLPYQVKDIVVPMRNYTDSDTYVLRRQSQIIDKSVTDYLTMRLPQPARSAVSSIAARYPVVSPFLCHILHDIASMEFPLATIDNAMSRMEVMAICQPYEWLLEFDPLNDDLRYDRLRTNIVVHTLDRTMDLKPNEYRFFKQVVDIYGQQLVDFSQYVTITP